MSNLTFTFDPGPGSTAALETRLRELCETHRREDREDHFHVERYGEAVVCWPPYELRRSPAEGKASSAALHGVDAPQLVLTDWEDHAFTGWCELFRAFDGEFVRIDTFHSQFHDCDKVLDYVLINYETRALVRTEDEDVPLTDDRDRIPGTPALPDEDAPSDRRKRVLELLRGDREMDPEGIAPLLDDDEYYHLVSRQLYEAVGTTDGNVKRGASAEVYDRLEGPDPAVRARAVRRVAAVEADAGRDVRAAYRDTTPRESCDPDRFRRFVEAIPTVDATTQRLVARTLWEPWVLADESVTDPGLVTALADLVDAETPEVRAGALTGAGRMLGRIALATESEDVAGPGLDDVAGAIAAFYEALAGALEDPDHLVRGRAVEMANQPLAADGRNALAYAFQDVFWHRTSFEVQWALARAFAARTVDEREAIATRATEGMADGAGLPFAKVLEDSPEAIDAFAEYAWDPDRPAHKTARDVLADHVEDDPGSFVAHVSKPVAAVREGTGTAADLRLLAAVASEAPDEVAGVTPRLEAVLDADGERRRQAARALVAVAAVRPAAVGVDHARLLEAVGGIHDEDGNLVPARLAVLAGVDPGRAAAALREVCGSDAHDSGEYWGSDVAEAIYRVGREDPAVVADAAGAVCRAVPASDTRTWDLVGVARAARERPAAFVAETGASRSPAAALAPALGAGDRVASEAVATALAAVGSHDPDAVPAPVRPLATDLDPFDPGELDRIRRRSDRAVQRDGPGPLALVAREDPAFAAAAVGETAGRHRARHRVAAACSRVYADDPRAGAAVCRRLLAASPDLLVPSDHRTSALERLVDDHPDLAVDLADDLVGILAGSRFENRDGDGDPSRPAGAVHEALLVAARRDPDRVRESVESAYGSLDAFVDDQPRDGRRAIREALATAP